MSKREWKLKAMTHLSVKHFLIVDGEIPPDGAVFRVVPRADLEAAEARRFELLDSANRWAARAAEAETKIAELKRDLEITDTLAHEETLRLRDAEALIAELVAIHSDETLGTVEGYEKLWDAVEKWRAK